MATTIADDMTDELGAENFAGVNYEAGVRDGWRLVGPVHKQRFATCTAATATTLVESKEDEACGEGGKGEESGSGKGANEASAAVGGEEGEEEEEDLGSVAMETDVHPLEEVRRDLMASDPFRRWLEQITKVK